MNSLTRTRGETKVRYDNKDFEVRAGKARVSRYGALRDRVCNSATLLLWDAKEASVWNAV